MHEGYGCWHASARTAYVLAIMALLVPVNYVRHPLSGKAAGSVRSQFACCINNNTNMVIKERKARLQEFLQNYELGYYNVTPVEVRHETGSDAIRKE